MHTHTRMDGRARTVELTPTRRAAVRLALAHAFGAGRLVTREQIITDLFGPLAVTATTLPVSPDSTPAEPNTTATAAPFPGAGAAVVFLEPVIPDEQPISPDPTPDVAVSFAAAAARLGLSVGTVRRYAAPSSDKLVRLGDGISSASVERLAAAR